MTASRLQLAAHSDRYVVWELGAQGVHLVFECDEPKLPFQQCAACPPYHVTLSVHFGNVVALNLQVTF